MCQADHICDLECEIDELDWAAIDACAIIMAAMPPGATLEDANDTTRRAFRLMADLDYIERLTPDQYYRARKEAVGY